MAKRKKHVMNSCRHRGRPQVQAPVIELRGLNAWKWRALELASFVTFMLWVARKAWGDIVCAIGS